MNLLAALAGDLPPPHQQLGPLVQPHSLDHLQLALLHLSLRKACAHNLNHANHARLLIADLVKTGLTVRELLIAKARKWDMVVW